MPANWRLLEAEIIRACEDQYASVGSDPKGDKYCDSINLTSLARCLADRVTLDSKAVQVKSQTPATDYWHTAGAD